MEISVFEKWPNIAVVSVVHPNRRRSSLFTPKATGGSGGLGEEELTAEVWFVSFGLPKPRPLLLLLRRRRRRRRRQQPRVLIPVREERGLAGNLCGLN